ncbi:uncharacterized protein LOC129002072 [Macrosteles quadrilineatus]|uniref:uncharacterized protein LOC129002072 n=1 Tax=Macrosteles quadrilineatus TaxID=74068 RepID=UPI0023E11231|nr:uncharacterized protein LOC129002072 [Macrosteles quadrilineatus]XP_054285569.1 uncharacterized protein LOC129002072 [Macrosteles quadrilineatus]
MWSIVKRLEDGNFDLVPNSWVQSHEECLYPNTGLSQIKKSAKNNEGPQEGWETVHIEIKKRNIDDFDRGMRDVIRYTQGKRSITSSENEEKGRGRRKKQKRRIFDDDSNNDETSESETTSPSCSKITFKPSAVVTSPPPNFPSLLVPRTPQPEAQNKQAPPQCKIAKGRKHLCAFDDNISNSTSNAHVLCHLSQNLISMKGNMAYFKEMLENISSKLDQLASRPSNDGLQSEAVCSSENILATLDGFPISNRKDLSEMEENLKSQENFNQAVNALSACAEKSSLSRTVTSTLRKLITIQLASQFTWKGMKRKDHRIDKMAFKDLRLAKLLFGVTAKCVQGKEDIDFSKVATIAASWLAQSAAKHDKLGQQVEDQTGEPQ